MIGPGWIGGIIIFIIFTEIVYFGWMRKHEDYFLDKSFLWNKFCSMSIAYGLTLFFYGIPQAIAYGGGIHTGMGEIAYLYYYGSMLTIALFFGINYQINNYLERRDIKTKRGKK